MNINRDWHIKFNPKTSKVMNANGIFFYTSDRNTCNMYIEIVEEYEELELEIIIVPPNAEDIKEVYFIKCEKLENKLYEVELPNLYDGVYKCEIKAISGEKFNTSDKFTYTVRPNLLRGDN